MNSQQELQRFEWLAGTMQLPKIQYTVKRYHKGWWAGYRYSIETEYCKIDNIRTFAEACAMLTSGGIRVLDINVDKSCYQY